MKNKILFIIPILALILAACQPAQSSQTQSSVAQATSFNQNVSSETKSSSIQAPSSSASSSNVVSSKTSSSSSSSQAQSSSASSSNAASSSQIQSSQAPSSNPVSSSETPSSNPVSSSSVPEEDVVVNIELFALNDMHGNVEDSSTGLGISKTSTLLKTYPNDVNNTLYISQGDMWQGSAASNLTRGQFVNDWMNQLHFASMTMGNHEFDWGTEYVRTNSQSANFPYLGINIFDRSTNKRVDYLDASTIINKNGAKIGIIGAIGDCYSSISASYVQDVYFKVGDELTNLVKNEAIRLKSEEKCDFVIYSLHEDDQNYDIELSNYVDLVLEGHTHKNYVRTDARGIYHIQSAGYNKTINYISIDINTTKDTFVVNKTKSIYTNDYSYLDKDSEAESLFTKYASVISSSNEPIGYNSQYRSSTEIKQLVADLYLEYGMSKWSANYDIYLGGGFISTRSPYNLYEGYITYADLVEILPFDNDLVLCSISGYDLNYKFVNTSNSNYYISLSDYGRANSYINFSDTYYVIVDTYTSDYASNNLTVIERYTTGKFYARDMLANYIAAGNFE